MGSLIRYAALKVNSSTKHSPGQSFVVSTMCEGHDQEDLTGSVALGKDQLDTAAVCNHCDRPAAGSLESALERHAFFLLCEWRAEALLHACWLALWL